MRLFNQSKKVAAVHDLSGVGHVSLMAVIPILSSMGIQVCPLPTAVLSTHTQYPEYTFLDLTDEMRRMTECWKHLDFTFERPDDLVVVDPVLGDNGRLYKGFGEEMILEMRRLIRRADVITPNITEVFLLLDRPQPEEALSDECLKELLKALSDQGPEIVIATSVPVTDNPHMTSVYAYNRRGDRYWKVTCPYLPAHYPGTGDSFTSVITGSLMQGDSLPIALDRATQFILQGIRATFGYEYNNMDGIMLEKVLHNLDMPIQSCSYELLE